LGSSALKPKVIILDLWMPYMDGLEFRAMRVRPLERSREWGSSGAGIAFG
jgi:CheY-like chemotaxis protein